MARSQRQQKILELIARQPIETQEELVDTLLAHGLKVTQATVSRDIKELGLIKTLDENSRKYRYSYMENENQKMSTKSISIFKHSVLSIDSADNLIVIKTLTGSANAAAAVVDKLDSGDILGSIAGDDTILVIAKSSQKVGAVVDALRSFLV